MNEAGLGSNWYGPELLPRWAEQRLQALHLVLHARGVRAHGVSGVIDARRSYPGPLFQDDEVPEPTNGSVSDSLGRLARIVAHSIRRSLLGV